MDYLIQILKQPFSVGPIVYHRHLSDEIIIYTDLLKITEPAMAKLGLTSSSLISELAFDNCARLPGYGFY